MKRLNILFILLILLSTVSAESIPKLNGYINDFANLLTPTEEESLSMILEDIEKTTTVEIALVTVKITDSKSRTLFAAKIGDVNGVGKSATDNGIVILWSESNERGGSIATGRGIESTLTDSKVVHIGKSSRSSFDSKNYYEGFTIIIDGVKNELNEFNQSSSNNVEYQQIPPFILGIIIIFAILLILIIIPGSGSGRGSFRPSSYIGSSNFGGFSGGSFGGGSFGGGGGSF